MGTRTPIMTTARILLCALGALAALSVAQAADMTTTEHTCCAVYWEKKDGHYDHIMEGFATEAEFCESSDATDHWCMFVNWKEYSVCQTGGIIVTVICVAIAGITVLLRDLMKTWDCFGFTTLPGFDKPVDRQLTTMSAAYAGATMMTAAPEAQFANIPACSLATRPLSACFSWTETASPSSPAL